MSKILGQLEYQVEISGYVPGTEEFARRLRAAKVEKCKEMQQVPHCSMCRAFLDCDLVKTYLKDHIVGRSSHGGSTE